MDLAMATLIMNKLDHQLNMGLPLNTCHTHVDLVSLTKTEGPPSARPSTDLTRPPASHPNLPLSQGSDRYPSFGLQFLHISRLIIPILNLAVAAHHPSPSQTYVHSPILIHPPPPRLPLKPQFLSLQNTVRSNIHNRHEAHLLPSLR